MEYFWMALATFAILQASALSTTIYLHRAVTHRGLALHPAVAFLMHLELLLFTGISPRHWAAVHRKHHHFSDKEGDPHSPLIRGLWTVLLGNYFLYRREAANPATIAKYTPDYKPDVLDRIPFATDVGVFVGLGLLMLAFGWMWGLIACGVHVVLYIFVNAMINGLGHMVGYRNYDNQATNLRWLALISAGEGLHNNHHEFPSSARLSLKPGEFDPAWPVIRLLAALRLARIRPEPVAKAAA